MKKIILPLLISVMVGLGGCSNLGSKLERQFNEAREGPKYPPYKSVTGFSNALSCVDDLMLAKGVKDISIMIEDISDKTESVPVGVRDMLVSAISEMTIKSKGIRLIVYGKDAGNLISFMKSANYTDVYKKVPIFGIQGSISQFDKDVAAADGSLGLFKRSEGGFGASRSHSLNVVALDLNVLRSSDMSIVPGVSSRNSVAIFQRGDSLDADASINKVGIYFDINLNRNEGKSHAVRTLVELAAVELVGKLVKVPYEQCLKK